jgi:hypothetical protein
MSYHTKVSKDYFQLQLIEIKNMNVNMKKDQMHPKI